MQKLEVKKGIDFDCQALIAISNRGELYYRAAGDNDKHYFSDRERYPTFKVGTVVFVSTGEEPYITISKGENKCEYILNFGLVEPTATTALIPFASGLTPINVSTINGSIFNNGFLATVGFGSSVTFGLIDAPGTVVSFSGIGNVFIPSLLTGNNAFTVPGKSSTQRTVTALDISFTLTDVFVSAGTSNIIARIFQASSGSNNFIPLGTSVGLSPKTSDVTFTAVNMTTNALGAGVVLIGRSEFNVPVLVGTQLLLVIFLVNETLVIGYATGMISGEITIV